MDYFSHAIWSYIFFFRTKKPIYALLCGLIPDTFSWLIYFIFSVVTGNMSRGGPPHLGSIPDWVFTLYDISHSIFVAALVILLIFGICKYYSKKFPIYILAWPIHILIDIPTHTREFLPTPFLWPVSDWVFPGISWGTSWFMTTNLILVIVCLSYVIWWRRKNKEKLK
ncbi:hypothetical protein HN695_03275 [Candidatus Woesearchaeota archaeon]|jgi:hypothetical protein|nr:hypothetical protein [Candidatus Woesearchaeota archaeon]MBT5272006.1 hypothetical protein [Candidatus Woesearchaeota archaeon]MBT6040747.1 hypothetical protein [Candidatus Woesearchaeota archaeon]MBT6336699.1 hypothetical protein [Candidatus Woesearchaeota archaeon]MBT7927332.1 hypothetical protein [Candidatus Woesearchaeota archaeon]